MKIITFQIQQVSSLSPVSNPQSYYPRLQGCRSSPESHHPVVLGGDRCPEHWCSRVVIREEPAVLVALASTSCSCSPGIPTLSGWSLQLVCLAGCCESSCGHHLLPVPPYLSFGPGGKPIRYRFFAGFVTEASDQMREAPWTSSAFLSMLPAFWGDVLTLAISFWDPVTLHRCLASELSGVLAPVMGPWPFPSGQSLSD